MDRFIDPILTWIFFLFEIASMGSHRPQLGQEELEQERERAKEASRWMVPMWNFTTVSMVSRGV